MKRKPMEVPSTVRKIDFCDGSMSNLWWLKLSQNRNYEDLATVLITCVVSLVCGGKMWFTFLNKLIWHYLFHIEFKMNNGDL